MKIDISSYKHIVILTGAGISSASGLHTYRGKGGIWEKYDVEKYGHVDRLTDHPEQIWELFGPLRDELKTAKPNNAHYALAELEKNTTAAQSFTLVTQNIDGLHQLAGSRNIIEYHGTIHQTGCSNPDCELESFDDNNSYQHEVPLCPECTSPLRPCIVLFGEVIPALQDLKTKQALRDCDLFISIGTSGSVYPASGFVCSAEYAGARTICINLDPISPPNPAFKEEYLGKAEEILPDLLGISVDKLK